MVDNGLDLAKMEAAIMGKIEELTLYTIEQEQHIDKLKTTFSDVKTENKVLKEKNQELERRLARLEKLILEKK